MTGIRELYDLDEQAPLGVAPPRMHAQVIRQSRYGEPVQAFAREIVPVPELGPTDVLVRVMAAGINYNNVWASLGVPVDVVRTHRQRGEAGDEEGFHIGGSDASGIVQAVGPQVTNVKPGDEVVLHCGVWDENDPQILAGLDPAFSNGFRIWGYDSNWGSFAQFARVQSHQCLPKPPQLTWEQAAAYTLEAATAYRMLAFWEPHTVQPGDVVLVWGGSGGLGSMGIQVTKALGGIPIAVVSSDERGEFCKQLGAAGYVDRTKFDHWGRLPDWHDEKAMTKAVLGFRAFGKAIWDVLGERRNPRIVFEHPGQDTVPTSLFICEPGGMVVICAGTTGYNADVDLRYLWVRQKRFQGSHFATDKEARAVNQLVAEGKIDPCLTRTLSFDEVGLAHQLMHENRHNGNMAILVGATEPGQK
ncbi:MAG TPA: crotonyl-CoA carboxylase/reductase [Dehalococcoidia bacterium]|jgi:crotonyl-CoA carboxylase/reductase|nr:crotonyl-CoA carboxylase/reductase [Dehalococcoidia bacterium]